MGSYEVLAVGDTYFDIIFADLPEFPKLGAEIFARDFTVTGGGIYNTAAAMARLGIEVGLITELGNDLFSELLLKMYRNEGIDTSPFIIHDGPWRMVTAAFSQREERGFVSFVERDAGGAPATYGPELLDRASSAKLLHLPGLENAITALPLAEAAVAGGMRLILDCQHTSRTIEDPQTARLLELAEIFLPNRAEATQLTGCADPLAAGRILAEKVSTVVIKMGPDGALLFLSDGTSHEIAGHDFGPAIDTTGAGDCFNAGFIYGLLRGYNMLECAGIGTICGALSVTAIGGATAIKQDIIDEAVKEKFNAR
jgi:sugar/nucleoside kinase (ribokinase family)